MTGLIRLAVAASRRAVESRCGRCRRNPVEFIGDQRLPHQHGVLVTLYHDQDIAFAVFGGHVPGGFCRITPSADAESLPLTQGVIHEPAVRAYKRSFRRFHSSRLRRQVFAEEVAEFAFADETDAGAVFSCVIGKSGLPCPPAYFVFEQCPHGEQSSCQRSLRNGMQEICLILTFITSAQKFHFIPGPPGTGIVTGGDIVRTQSQRMIKERLEFYFTVAQNVRIGRAARSIFIKKVMEHVLTVCSGKIRLVQGDAELLAHLARILKILCRRAISLCFIIFPILHEQTFHGIALFLQQQGGDGGVHAA